MRTRLWALLASLAMAFVACGGSAPGGESQRPGFRAPTPSGEARDQVPSIVLIVTDDQRWDAIEGMPRVQSRLVARGVRFTNGFVVNPLCCPSRASILTGQYSHSTGIWTNQRRYGGFRNFDDRSTVATWLDGAGYETALVGKYLNGYDGVTIPPGWDRWVAFADRRGAYFDYDLNIDGAIVGHGSSAPDYSTDVLRDEAVSFIRSVEPPTPLFLMFAPFAPHAPATPAPRHGGALHPARWSPPSFNERNVNDKPRWLQEIPRLDRHGIRDLQLLRRRQYRSLLAVDQAVGKILRALAGSGRLGSTMIVLTSDNGLLWGEHRVIRKQAAYNESIRVPFVVRYDSVTGWGIDGRLALNIDLAPTFARLAGVEAPGVDGRSLLPLLRNEQAAWRRMFIVEHVRGGGQSTPTYCAVRSTNRVFVRYRTGEEEYYNLVKDPYELVNRARRPSASTIVKRLRRAAERLCSPPPPGLTF